MMATRWIMACSSLALLAGCAAQPEWAEREPRTGVFDLNAAFSLDIPDGAEEVRVWFPLPQAESSEFPSKDTSVVRDLEIETDHDVQIGTDSQGNEVGYIEVADPTEDELTIDLSFTLEREEVLLGAVDRRSSRPLTDAELEEFAPYLASANYMPTDGEIKQLAEETVGGTDNPVEKARRLYDWTLENIDYWVKNPDEDEASSTGDAQFCLDTGSGNCTDFHALWGAMARSVDVPTRLVYGGLLKENLNALPVDASYHCWVEFYAPEIGWVPLDASVADLWYGDGADISDLSDEDLERVENTCGTTNCGDANREVVDYYFSNVDERRVVWHYGRDIVLDPAQDGPELIQSVFGYYEIDGEVAEEWNWDVTLDRLFTYEEVDAEMGDAWPLR